MTDVGKSSQPALQQTTTRPSTAASTSSSITTLQHQTTQTSALPTRTSMSPNSSQQTISGGDKKRLVFTARYLLSIDCRDAMMEPQPAVLLSAARYKYKDLQIICGKSIDDIMIAQR